MSGKNYFSNLHIEKRVSIFQERLNGSNDDYYTREAKIIMDRMRHDFTPLPNGEYETTSSRSIAYAAYNKEDAISLMKGSDPVFWVNVTIDQDGGSYPESYMNVCIAKAGRRILVKRHSNPKLGGIFFIQIPLNDYDILLSSKSTSAMLK